MGETSAGEYESDIDPFDIPLGSYPDVQSPWGLLDVSGGAMEWLEEPIIYPDGQLYSRGLNGTYAGAFSYELEMDLVHTFNPVSPGSWGGLRVASAVPAPGGLFVFVLSCVVNPSRRRKN